MKALWFAFLVFALPQNNGVTELGTIRGTITRTDKSEPLSGVTVTLQGGNADPQALQALLNGAAAQGIVVTPRQGASTLEIVQAISAAGQARGMAQVTVANIQSQLSALSGRSAPTTTTDRDGHFTFSDIAPGGYTVRVQKEGFFGRPEGGRFPATGAVEVNVAAKETKDANLAMVPGSLIGGRVFDTNGQLLSNAIVWALRVDYQVGHAVLSGQTNKATDDRGEFRVFWVPPGEYYLTAEPPRAVAVPGAAGPAGQGIKTFYPGVTEVTEARIISLKGGEEVLGMDIGIRPIKAFKVTGQINSLIPPPATPLGAPTANSAVLVLLNRDPNAPDDTKQVGTVPLLPTTGRFEIPRLIPGAYELFARVPDAAAQAAGGAPLAWGRTHLDIRDADVENISITIPPSSEVKGVVTAPGGKVPSSIRVQLSPDDEAAKGPYQQVSSRAAPVDAAGAFSVPAVPEGRFRVASVIGLPQDMYLADVRQNALSVFDSGFDVNVRNANPVEVVLGTGAGTVNGVVTDGPTKSVPGAFVVLIPETKRRNNRALYVTATTDVSGRFTLRGVAPGDYKAFAWESIPSNAHVNAAFMAKHEDRGKPVHVNQQGTASVELPLIPAIAR
jgi:hypothetical protein